MQEPWESEVNKLKNLVETCRVSTKFGRGFCHCGLVHRFFVSH